MCTCVCTHAVCGYTYKRLACDMPENQLGPSIHVDAHTRRTWSCRSQETKGSAPYGQVSMRLAREPTSGRCWHSELLAPQLLALERADV